MSGRARWLKWLHRIGYVTTALIVAEIGFVGFELAKHFIRNRAITAQLREDTRTVEGPVRIWDDARQVGTFPNMFASLPASRNLKGNGLRFVAIPSFGTSSYAVALSLSPHSEAAKGTLVVVDKTVEPHTSRSRQFIVRASDYRRFASDFDKLTDGFAGEEDFCVDGTPAAFERVRGNRLTSGWGNCSDHYHRVKATVLKAVRRWAPGPDLPSRDNDWHRFNPGEERYR